MEQNTPLPFRDKVIDVLRRYCNIHFGGSARAFSVFLGFDPTSGMVSRWMRGTDSGPTLQKIGPVMDKLGVVLFDPNDPMDVHKSTMKVDELSREKEQLKKELEQAKAMISQLTGERNAFRAMVLTLTQKQTAGDGSAGTITNLNVNKNF